MKNSKKYPRIFISVLNWNASSKTLACIESIRKNTYQNYFLRVVDNNSKINERNFLIDKLPSEEILLLNNNLGYSHGHFENFSTMENWDYVWILNNDLTIDSNALNSLIKAIKKFHENSFYGSISVNPETKKYENNCFAINKTGKVDFNNKIDMNGPNLHMNGEIIKVGSLSGFSVLFSKQLLEKAGFYNCDFFMYGEEEEYSKRLDSLGIPSFLVLNSIVYHEDSYTTKSNPEIYGILQYYRYRNWVYTMVKYDGFKGKIKIIIDYAFNIISLTTKIVVSLLKLKKTNDALVLYYKNLGFWDGFHKKLGIRFKPEEYINDRT